MIRYRCNGGGGDEGSGRKRVVEARKQLIGGHDQLVGIGASRLHLLGNAGRQSGERVARPAAVHSFVTAVEPAAYTADSVAKFHEFFSGLKYFVKYFFNSRK